MQPGGRALISTHAAMGIALLVCCLPPCAVAFAFLVACLMCICLGEPLTEIDAQSTTPLCLAVVKSAAAATRFCCSWSGAGIGQPLQPWGVPGAGVQRRCEAEAEAADASAVLPQSFAAAQSC